MKEVWDVPLGAKTCTGQACSGMSMVLLAVFHVNEPEIYIKWGVFKHTQNKVVYGLVGLQKEPSGVISLGSNGLVLANPLCMVIL